MTSMKPRRGERTDAKPGMLPPFAQYGRFTLPKSERTDPEPPGPPHDYHDVHKFPHGPRTFSVRSS